LPNTWTPSFLSASDSLLSSCFIPSPVGGGCLCVGIASYSVELNSISGIHTVSLAELVVTHLDATITGAQQLTAEIGGGGQSGTISLAISGNVFGSATACNSDFSATGTVSGVATFGLRVLLSVTASQCTVDSINCEQHGVHFDIQVDQVSLINRELTNLQFTFTGTDPLAIVLNAAGGAIPTLIQVLSPSLFEGLTDLFIHLLVPEAQRNIDGELEECYNLDLLNDGQETCNQCDLPAEWLCSIRTFCPCF
jgi:hypothetical protein